MKYQNLFKEYISDLLNVDEYFTDKSNIIDIKIFQQVWESTTLGFNGIGGASMTPALTIVVIENNKSTVFFGGRKAYVVKPNSDGVYNEFFLKDLYKENMESVSGAKKYDDEK